MNNSLAPAQLDKDLQNTKDIVAIIPRLIAHAMKEIDSWLREEDRKTNYDYEWVMTAVHADKIRQHCTALAGLVAGLGTPSGRRVLSLSDGARVLDPEKISETSDAYDNNKLNNLGERDIRDAIEFKTELKDMFGLAWIDDEISEPLRDALHLLCELMEDGVAIVPGAVVRVLKVLLQGHPRGFSKYYTGIDPWPRPSVEIQAEIDARMPDALDWLRCELREALEEEAQAGNSLQSGSESSENVSSAEASPGSAEALFMLRPRIDKPDPMDGKVIVAVDPDTCIGDPKGASKETLDAFWADCCSRISRPNVEWCKAGAVIWDHLNVKVPADWVAFALSLKTADDDMVRATQAAIFSAVATTVGPVDYDSLVHTVATFIHSHPAFRDIAQEGVWRLPFGDRTTYCVVNAPKPQD